MSPWVSHLIGWHVYPLGFCGAPTARDAATADKLPGSGGDPAAPHVTHRLRGLHDWLSYVTDLGLNAIQLGPVFDSSSHGYDTLDYFRVDPRLGTNEDLDALIADCHERGIKVLADGVFNHVGRDNPLVTRALDGGPGSSAAELFSFASDGEQPPRLRCFEGHEDLVTLDHESPEVAELVLSVMDHWTSRGVDGWRLDAAYAVAPTFWRSVLPRLRERHPEVFIYGEVIHGDYQSIVEESTVDSVTQYELWKAIWSSLREKNFYELQWNLERHNEFLESFTPVTFVGNHDVTRIATQIGKARAKLAALVLMTVGGIPLVYYGDEQAYTGVKEERIGGDDQIRPVFPRTPEMLSDLGRDMADCYHDLIALRRTHPWLGQARVTFESLDNEVVRYRSQAGDNALIVELDIRGDVARGTVLTPSEDRLLFEVSEPV